MDIIKRIRKLFDSSDYPWYKKLSRWLNIEWYKYLFKPWRGFKTLFCRFRGHGDVIWFNSGGLEPDMRCKNCGEDLG